MLTPPSAADSLPHLGPLRLPQGSLVSSLLRRIGLAIGLILGVTVVLWFDRGGLRDNAHPDRLIRLVDVFYFTVVSLTTVGYGDIAPVSTGGRLINALLLTPIRIFLWALFLGTAYEVTLLRLRIQGERRLRDLRERLHGHVVVCGYGVKGRAIVDELIAHGHQPQNIVAIDQDEANVAVAAGRGLVALRGDASTETMLRTAAIETAAHVLVAPHRDDVCVLICLTVRSLAPDVELVAAAREEENVKLLYGAGANLVVAPSVSGGRLMAAAVRQEAVPHFLEDMMAFGGGLSLAERVVTPAEDGLLPGQLPDLAGCLVLGVARGGKRIPFSRCAAMPLQAGDHVVYISAGGTVEADRA